MGGHLHGSSKENSKVQLCKCVFYGVNEGRPVNVIVRIHASWSLMGLTVKKT